MDPSHYEGSGHCSEVRSPGQCGPEPQVRFHQTFSFLFLPPQTSTSGRGAKVDVRIIALHAVGVSGVFRNPSRGHGSSEGHEMLKRSDKYHSIADDVPIPKM